MSDKCHARWDRGKRVCTVCNLTWSTSEPKPPCRPRWYGDQKIAEIRKLLQVRS